MNAKNDLECAGIANFLEIANVGSTAKVNIIVELGRPIKHHYTSDEGGWSGVLRFHVSKGMHPVVSSAINPSRPEVRNADMGSGETLSDFVRWSEENYPAKKFMLVIWNHGQGWRFYQQLAVSDSAKLLGVAYPEIRNLDDEPQHCGPSAQTLTGGVRSVSFDEDTGNYLYNRDVANSLRNLHLDVLGFDACLMATIEGAYAFRHVADVMVASEELVPGDGWNYDIWLRALEDHPEIDGSMLARGIVSSYQTTYGDSGDTTLSAIHLATVEEATQALSNFSLLVKSKLSTEGPLLAFTRLSFRTFGDWYQDSWQDCQGSKVMRFQTIDLIQFLDLYGRKTKDAQIKAAIKRVERQLQGVIIARYASSLSAGADHWASGLAVYFPSSELDYQCDTDRDGYDIEAVRAGLIPFPPEFVERRGWADLLREYLRSRISPISSLE
ncbi:MAG TPA: clostripain-related cysteine peptidase [Candidatus Acidoferrales bacterium]